MKKSITIGIIAFIVGFVLADYIAFHFSQVHGYDKRGGIFQSKNN